MQNNRLISPEGMETLRSEWEALYREERPRLLLEIAAAAEQGDRSENAEYIYGKKRLREIDKRLRQLDEKISGSTVVEGTRRNPGTIAFGARVHLKKQDGKESVLQIVGVDEIDPIEGKISMDSPMGKALMGQTKGNSIQVNTPRGPAQYEIMAVDYP